MAKTASKSCFQRTKANEGTAERNFCTANASFTPARYVKEIPKKALFAKKLCVTRLFRPIWKSLLLISKHQDNLTARCAISGICGILAYKTKQSRERSHTSNIVSLVSRQEGPTK